MGGVHPSLLAGSRERGGGGAPAGGGLHLRELRQELVPDLVVSLAGVRVGLAVVVGLVVGHGRGRGGRGRDGLRRGGLLGDASAAGAPLRLGRIGYFC